MSSEERCECPICGKMFSESKINYHVNFCLQDDDTELTNKRKNSNSLEPGDVMSQPLKRPKNHTIDNSISEK